MNETRKPKKGKCHRPWGAGQCVCVGNLKKKNEADLDKNGKDAE